MQEHNTMNIQRSYIHSPRQLEGLLYELPIAIYKTIRMGYFENIIFTILLYDFIKSVQVVEIHSSCLLFTIYEDHSVFNCMWYTHSLN